MSRSQPRLHFNHGGEAQFKVLNGNVIKWACYSQRVLIPGVAEPMKASLLTIVGYSPEPHCRSAPPAVGLNCGPLVPPVSLGELFNL